ncbi:hypothetical protein F4Z99_18035 [Candidatus Poribacteria bacterium]|nr:hypothetical protein [Candidatus Poribacteria bacterium]
MRSEKNGTLIKIEPTAEDVSGIHFSHYTNRNTHPDSVYPNAVFCVQLIVSIGCDNIGWIYDPRTSPSNRVSTDGKISEFCAELNRGAIKIMIDTDTANWFFFTRIDWLVQICDAVTR